ncbi:lysE family transporter protein [Legionella lansingensis]|uniref:LysE family transporter protein n=1 Tax=Legionella lansingensis TaxID=45067 RepID=A0A0W0VZ37_9GAMM|nr:LysE family translocator [Legionella lansingensis]KTD25429.1 lysE family transporter protein [Legionella lansingensis]SNV51429.1 lysE family transporter protein [Legionella lansingensis]
MLTQVFTIGLLMLLAVMLPGPDFALVTKNTLVHSRRSGFFTTFGVGASNFIHMAYCALGLAIIISNSLLFFSVIKYMGAAYLIYLGISSLLSEQSEHFIPNKSNQFKKSVQSDFSSFRQGFLCNLLNPKATLFFLALFTTIIKPDTPSYWVILFVIEMLFIITLWFLGLTFILSHPKIITLLERAKKYIEKILGVFLVSFGIALACIRK